MSKWDSEKDYLEKSILIDKKSYEALGREYGVSGNAIKKAAKNLGIELPQRRKINPKETFNKTLKISETACNVESDLNNVEEDISSIPLGTRKIMHCHKHGDTEFSLQKSGKTKRWKCLKCEVDAVQKRRDKIKVMAVAYKGGKCVCCGYNRYIGALEFHHTDPTQKDFGISASGYTRSWDSIMSELDKCVLVCANCHREIHSGILNCPQIYDGDLEAVKKASIEFEKIYNN